MFVQTLILRLPDLLTRTRSQVGPRAEAAPRPSHDHHAHIIVVAQDPNGVDHLIVQIAAERVQLLRPIKRDRADMVGNLKAQVLVSHGRSPSVGLATPLRIGARSASTESCRKQAA